jgi:hypothetical protein
VERYLELSAPPHIIAFSELTSMDCIMDRTIPEITSNLWNDLAFILLAYSNIGQFMKRVVDRTEPCDRAS